jgi:hypothetical protein
LPGPVAVDARQSQDGTVKNGLHRPRLSAIIIFSRSPALILIAAPFPSSLSRVGRSVLLEATAPAEATIDPPFYLLARRWIGREETMSTNAFAIGLCGLTIAVSTTVFAQQSPVVPSDDPTKALVGRLDLERYKATIRGLGQFGDRQQGTDRNRTAVDWIEAQLRSYGCTTERIRYV